MLGLYDNRRVENALEQPDSGDASGGSSKKDRVKGEDAGPPLLSPGGDDTEDGASDDGTDLP